MDCVTVKILFFAKARELSGVKECNLTTIREITYANLKKTIVSEFHLESIRENLILALNENFVTEDVTFHLVEKDEIAVIPPLSGGLFIF
ncbi:molybdopterin synthase sulfur carrier subunit [Leptopilina heterotoma]|uniref:molybdopterin synthase sulfur carrier subunit n=1 Tax=Leptopilina heterotoma TaxID=63436 RepID=UPI001CA966F7|nr:molybdopterin synthase sulfur carrier subunit [Leptopilina heterotoma]